jgi:hypothetical protein
MVSVLHLQA